MQELKARLAAATLAMLLVVGGSSLAIYLLGGGLWSAFDCFYFVIITLTTVGFSELLPGMADVEYARPITLVVIVTGVGTFLYFASTLTAIIIEGDLQRAFKDSRMHKNIDRLTDHVIVCGAGSTGRHVMQELVDYNIDTVLIDIDPEAVALYLESHPKAMCIVGDATDDDILTKANVRSARGIVAAMPGDKENLYLTISARQTSSTVRIVARGSDLRVLEKLRTAGADTAVSPNYIGGLRMVSELLRPKVVRFLDDMRKDISKTRIDEVEVPASSTFIGKNLMDLHMKNVLVLAVRLENGSYQYNPGAKYVIQENMTLIVLGPILEVEAIRVQAGSAV